MLILSIFGENILSEFFRNPSFDDRDIKKLEKEIHGRRDKNLTKTDTRKTDTGYELEMDLPGFKKDEIKVSLKDGYLIICVVKSLDKDEQEKNSDRRIRQERYAGACGRSLYVGGDMTDRDMKGEFKHGILRLSIPKKDAKSLVEGKKYISIER